MRMRSWLLPIYDCRLKQNLKCNYTPDRILVAELVVLNLLGVYTHLCIGVYIYVYRSTITERSFVGPRNSTTRRLFAACESSYDNACSSF